MVSKNENKKRIDQLTNILLKHQKFYYVDALPQISDGEYDRLYDELALLEKKFPEFCNENSPTQRVGSDLSNDFKDYKHKIDVLSLDKVYQIQDLEEWMIKRSKELEKDLNFVLEKKFDGASIILYYEKGELVAGVTRGNGTIGNDVTKNVKTIKEIPLKVPEKIDFSLRGEIYLEKEDFEKIKDRQSKEYANPRNLAAGTLRNIHSSTVAKVPLKLAVYSGNFNENVVTTHLDSLKKLKELGFKIEKNISIFCKNNEILEKLKNTKNIEAYGMDQLERVVNDHISGRKSLNHEIDGLVFKINSLDARKLIGATSHHPKWAIAYKFESPSANTAVESIDIQIGRNGRVTPVANLVPVDLAGSVISKATLHNQDYINMLGLHLGDMVKISKRGDIIPAVECVIKTTPNYNEIYKIRSNCPFCLTKFVRDGAHLFCQNRKCPERIKRQIIYFCQRDRMDVESLGEKTIAFLFDKNLIQELPDLYSFDYSRLLEFDGFKEKKISNIVNSLEKSKKQPFSRVLLSMGFENLGQKNVEILISNGFNSIDKIIKLAEESNLEFIAGLDGIGEQTASQIVDHFSDPQNLDRIEALIKAGLNFVEEILPYDSSKEYLKGQTWVITGSFKRFESRKLIEYEIKSRGGRITGTVSSRTSHILVGEKPGSKYTKAKKLDITIVEEIEFVNKILKN